MAKSKALTKKSKLSPKQLRFIGEYMKDLNATQAAIRTGYSAHSAKQTGTALLSVPSIALEITFRVKQRDVKLIASADQVLETLTVIGKAKNKDFLVVDENGRTTAELDLQKVGEHPVGEMTFGKLGTAKDGSSIVGLKKIKPPAPLTALEMLAKHHKLLTDKVEHDLSEDLVKKLNAGRARVGQPPIDITGKVIENE